MTVVNDSKKSHKNLPVLHGRINESKVEMFLDTGSEVNVINKRALTHLLGHKVKLSKCHFPSVNFANETKMQIKGG